MMKKILIILIFPAMLLVVACNGSKSAVSQEDLKTEVQAKVHEMQKLIHFDDAQAAKLMDLEFRHAEAVKKAENALFCSSKKRVAKLQSKKSQELQKILTREQYIKYDAIENKRIKKGNLIAK